MARKISHIIQPATVVSAAGGVVNVVITGGMEAAQAGFWTTTAFLYVKAESEVGTATLDIEVFNVVMGKEYSLGNSLLQITAAGGIAYGFAMKTAATGYPVGAQSEIPLDPEHFIVRQTVTGTSSPAFTVTIELHWLPMSIVVGS